MHNYAILLTKDIEGVRSIELSGNDKGFQGRSECHDTEMVVSRMEFSLAWNDDEQS
jgi:hypothetical protein